jgi:hypothetical protein
MVFGSGNRVVPNQRQSFYTKEVIMKFRKAGIVLLVFAAVFLLANPCFAARGVTDDTIKLGLILVKTEYH